ncbi:MAG TPA: S8 family serine peptidase [Pseudomonadota bacterium]|nr:S8 family serine peptidase [Pseudomonadota bacterium]
MCKTRLALVLAVLGGVLLGGVGCAPRRVLPPPLSVSDGQRFGTEEFVRGHALVEVRRGARLPMEQPLWGQELVPAPEQTVQVGGERLWFVRTLWPEPPEGSPILQKDPQAGAIVLLSRLEAGPATGSDAGDAAEDAETVRWLARLAQDPLVRRAEPDRIRYAAQIPNDPLWPLQWALPQLRVEKAWDAGAEGKGVVVAILDTGIVYNHPDLESQLLPGFDFISRPQSADDGDTGRDPDPTDTGTTETSRLHGTHISGTIGAVTNNKLGIAGVAPRCRLMPVRVLGIHRGDGIDSDITDALRWLTGAQVGALPVVSSNVDVVNMSFAGPGLSFTLQRAMNEVTEAGLLVVAASGNGGVDALSYSPGGLDGVLTVGASTFLGHRAMFSNFGPRVDVLAPGGGFADGELDADLLTPPPDAILSTYRDAGLEEKTAPPFSYESFAGTSQAAPHAAGVAALMRQVLPGLRQRTFVALLRSSAQAVPGCLSDPLSGCGAGLIDAERAVQLSQAQTACGCVGDLLCEAGACQKPPSAHDSVWASPVLSSPACAVGPRDTGAASFGFWAASCLVLVAFFAIKASRKT